MISEIKLKNYIGLILQAGILTSIFFVTIGGILFLYEHGAEPFANNTLVLSNHILYVGMLFQRDFWLTPLGLIDIGLFILVGAQILRVALLCVYYTLIVDKWFMFFSYFILFVIVYSF